jgi:hypothetical protein
VRRWEAARLPLVIEPHVTRHLPRQRWPHGKFRPSQSARIRAGRGRAEIPVGCGAAGVPYRRARRARLARGSAPGAQCRVLSAGCGRLARHRRAATRRTLARAGGSPHRNAARRRRGIRPLRSRVPGRAIDRHADNRATCGCRTGRRSPPRQRVPSLPEARPPGAARRLTGNSTSRLTGGRERVWCSDITACCGAASGSAAELAGVRANSIAGWPQARTQLRATKRAEVGGGRARNGCPARWLSRAAGGIVEAQETTRLPRQTEPSSDRPSTPRPRTWIRGRRQGSRRARGRSSSA